MTKKKLIILFFVCVLIGAGSSIYRKCFADNERPLVILSVNDMHAAIYNFPKFVTAVKECRDTADVILVDGGDKWTGNAYVDLVEHYKPMYELMNYVGFDFGIYGNHEFDKTQAYLAESNKQAEFEILGANIKSDTSSFPQPPAYTVIEKGGVKIAFVGVIGNYSSNNHPSGFDESFAGLTFSDPQTTAAEYSYLKDDNDLLILVTHMGIERDREFLKSENSKGYDMVIGAHSHSWGDEIVNGRPLGQAKSRLYNMGVTRVNKDTDGNITLDYENLSLKDYKEDSIAKVMVDGYYDNPELKKEIATVKGKANVTGMTNIFLNSLINATGAEISFYNGGGVRLSYLKDGSKINIATILNMEPFNNQVATITMTPAQMEKMILSKFNDRVNVGEAGSIDLHSTTPYTIITDKNNKGIKVVFPELTAGKEYKVALGSYIFSTYDDVEGKDGGITEIQISDAIREYISKSDILIPDNTKRQSVKKQ